MRAEPFCDDEYVYSFTVPPWYERWVGKNYPDLADSFDEDGALYFKQKEIRDQVCKPVVDEIVNKTDTFARSCGCTFNYVFLVGGLSALEFLRVPFEAMVSRLNASVKTICEANWRENHTCHGGSIMRGAVILMVFKGMIRRISSRNYYYRLFVKLPSSGFDKKMAVEALKQYYAKLGMTDKEWGLQSMAIYRSLEYVPDSRFELQSRADRVFVNAYVPICLKGFPAQIYVNRGLYKISGDAGEIKIRFYSSADILSFVGFEPPKSVRDEGELSVWCRAGSTVDVEIDFNEAHQNALEVKLTNSDHQTESVFISAETQIGY